MGFWAELRYNNNRQKPRLSMNRVIMLISPEASCLISIYVTGLD